MDAIGTYLRLTCVCLISYLDLLAHLTQWISDLAEDVRIPFLMGGILAF